MLNFYEYILKINEVAEPIKTAATRRMVVKNGGTYKEKKVVEYKFTTSLGNEVKLHFDKTDDNPKTYDVVFYVNDTQYDDASKTENENRDPEILSKVIYLIKKKADDLKAQEIHFTAQKGDGDVKTIKNMDVNKYKNNLLTSIDKFKNEILNHEVVMIPAKKEIYLKLGRPVPPDRPSIDKEKWVNILDRIKKSVQNNEDVNPNEIETSIYMDKISDYINTSNFLNLIKNFSMAVASNNGGYIRIKNRRQAVYSRLMDKYFTDWDVEKSGDSFKLKRRSTKQVY